MAFLPVTFIDPLPNGSYLGLLWFVYNTCQSNFTWGRLLAFAQYWVERPRSLWPYYLGNSCPAPCSILPMVDAYSLNTILENRFYFCALILARVSCPFSNCMLCFTNACETYFSAAVVIQPPSCVQLFETPWTAGLQASLSFAISQSLLKLSQWCHPTISTSVKINYFKRL